ncbi:MAG: hypothetical protein IT585_05315 [candidate division Zixibacteria bacterium]|nr:hypothetical protein [candidate division Zixibacteria bacterium]
MRKLIPLLSLALFALAVLASCASEAPEITKLYTDAKSMWDEINKSFSLPRGAERTAAMNKFIAEKWDEKIIGSLTQYLEKAPSGKHIAEAKKLLEEARNSQALRAFAQARPLFEQMGAPKTPEEAESLTVRWQRQQQQAADTTGATSVPAAGQ